MWLFKKPLEPETETIKKIYNQIAAIQADIERIKAELEGLQQKHVSLRNRINRKGQPEEETANEKPLYQPSFPSF